MGAGQVFKMAMPSAAITIKGYAFHTTTKTKISRILAFDEYLAAKSASSLKISYTS